MNVHYLLLFGSVEVVVFTFGRTVVEIEESYLIRQVLMKNYDPMVRPVANGSRPVDLSISIGLKSLIELDMRKQTLNLFGWLTVNWYDHNLWWDVERYPAERVHLSPDMIWRPDLIVSNTVHSLDQFEDQKVKVIVEHGGKVTWCPGGLLEVFCSIDISHYPLDTQVCSVDIMPWSSDVNVLNGTFMDPAFEDVETESHPEWEIVDTNTVYTLRPTNYWVLQFQFTIKRRVMFYVLNSVLPILLMSPMNCLAFLLPAESGEKMTVSITVFLFFAVFMSLINESLPPNSDSLCLFNAYVAVQMFLSLCSLIMATFIVFIVDRDSETSSPSHKQYRSTSSDKNNSSDLFSNSGKVTPSSSNITLDTLCATGLCDIGRPPDDCILVNKPTTRPCGQVDGDGRRKRSRGQLKSPRKRTMSLKLAWHVLTGVADMSSQERRQLSRHLDKTCFVLTAVINLISCFVFLALMIAL